MHKQIDPYQLNGAFSVSTGSNEAIGPCFPDIAPNIQYATGRITYSKGTYYSER